MRVTAPSKIGAVCDRVHKEDERDDAEGVNADRDNCKTDGRHSKYHISAWRNLSNVEKAKKRKQARARTCDYHEYRDIERGDDCSDGPAQPAYGRPHAHDEHALLDARFLLLTKAYQHIETRNRLRVQSKKIVDAGEQT